MVTMFKFGLVVLSTILLIGCGQGKPAADGVKQIPFAGKSETAPEHTLVTPVLEREIRPGENLIWCATSQLAWNELMTLAGGKIRMDSEDPVVGILNRRPVSGSDLDEKTYHAFSGFFGDGVIEKNRNVYETKFPGEPLPDIFTNPPRLAADDFVAWAFLRADLPFLWKFRRNESHLIFSGVPVENFGVLQYVTKVKDEAMAMSQLGIYDFRSPDDFIIELKMRDALSERNSHVPIAPEFPKEWKEAEKVADAEWRKNYPVEKSKQGHRLFLAKVPPSKTLEETVAGVRKRLANSRPSPLGIGREVAIPIIDFDLTCSLTELTGKPLRVSHPRISGRTIGLAFQQVRFRLDERGAVLKSEAGLLAGIEDENLIFDKPFLVLIEYAGAKEPYFAMWVANAELMLSERNPVQ